MCSHYIESAVLCVDVAKGCNTHANLGDGSFLYQARPDPDSDVYVKPEQKGVKFPPLPLQNWQWTEWGREGTICLSPKGVSVEDAADLLRQCVTVRAGLELGIMVGVSGCGGGIWGCSSISDGRQWKPRCWDGLDKALGSLLKEPTVPWRAVRTECMAQEGPVSHRVHGLSLPP